MRALLLGLLALPLFGNWNDFWYVKRTGTYTFANYCTLTSPGITAGATGRIHLASSATCGLDSGSYNDTNRFVWIGMTMLASGQRSAVVTGLANSTDDGGRCRLLKAVSGQPNQWDVHKCDNSGAVSTTGESWSNGGVVLPVELISLTGHPRRFADGPAGAIVTRLRQTTAGGYWQAGRTMKTVVTNLTDAYIGAYAQEFGSDLRMTMTPLCAVRWWAEADSMGVKAGSGDPAHDCAEWGIKNLEQYMPATVFGGEGASEIWDYRISIYAASLADSWDWASSLLSTSGSPSEKQTKLNFIWNDNPPNLGGHDYYGAAHTVPVIKTLAAGNNWNYTNGSKVVTSGSVPGNFNPELSVGDVILSIPPSVDSNYGIPYKIASVDSDTQVTLTKAYGYENHDSAPTESNKTLYVASPWANGKTGFIRYKKTSSYSNLAKNNALHPSNSTYGSYDNAIAGLYAGQYENGFFNNHALAHLAGAIMIAGAMADDDPRANVAYTDWLLTWYVIHQRPLMASTTPISLQGAGYNPNRTIYYEGDIYGSVKLADASHAEYIPPKLWEILASHTMANYIYLGSSENTVWGYQNGGNAWYKTFGLGQIYNSGAWSVLAAPAQTWSDGSGGTSTIAGNLRHFLANRLQGFGTSSFNGGNGWWQAFKTFMLDDPGVTAVAPTKTSFSLTPLKAECDAQFTAGRCPTMPKFAFYSFAGPNNGDAQTAFHAVSFQAGDQFTQCPETQLGIAINQRVLYGADAEQYYACPSSGQPRNSVLVIGATTNSKDAYPLEGAITLERLYETTKAMVATVNLVDTFKSSASVTVARQTVVDLKGGGADKNIIFTRQDVAAASATITQHHTMNVEGVCSPASCTSFITTTAGSPGKVVYTANATARLIGYLTGGTVAYVGAQTGNQGYGARLTQSITGTVAKFVNVWRPAPSNTETMADPTMSSNGTFEYGEAVLADGTVGVVGISDGTNATSGSVITTHAGSGQYLWVGVAAGTYKVRRNGSTVSGCDALTVAAAEYVLTCPAVLSGTITFLDASTPDTSAGGAAFRGNATPRGRVVYK